MKGFVRFYSAAFVLLLLSFLPVPERAFGQEDGSADSLLQQITTAGDSDFYDKALSLIDEGVEAYPGDHRFPMARGDLYESQELYSLALDSFREAEGLAPQDVELRKKTASALSYLDRNFEALDYLEALVREGADEVLDDLGWMYFKTHRPEEGVVLLEEALDKEFDRNLSLTLGTLYSELNDAELCRKYYLEAITDALKYGDSYFASVGYYNLSLAEKSFYDYEAALDYARRSLELMDRAAGHLALGDLYHMRQDFSEAEREYRQAVDLDKTPLSRSNLSSFYLVQGRLDEAFAQLKKIEEAVGDESWMYYYGLNQDQFTMDLYRQYHDLYRARVNQTSLLKAGGWAAGFRRAADLVVYRGKAIYYETLYRILALREGRSQLQGGAELRGNLTIASGTEGFRHYSVRYYSRARELEDFIQAEPWYKQMIGRELPDRKMLLEAGRSYDPEWEAFAVTEGVRELALLARPGTLERDELVSRVYMENPGALLQYNLPLPVRVEFSGRGMERLDRRRIRRVLKQSGFLLRSYDDPSLVLRINLSDSLQYSLSSREGTVLVAGNYPVSDGSSDEYYSWSLELRSRVFGF